MKAGLQPPESSEPGGTAVKGLRLSCMQSDLSKGGIFLRQHTHVGVSYRDRSQNSVSLRSQQRYLILVFSKRNNESISSDVRVSLSLSQFNPLFIKAFSLSALSHTHTHLPPGIRALWLRAPLCVFNYAPSPSHLHNPLCSLANGYATDIIGGEGKRRIKGGAVWYPGLPKSSPLVCKHTLNTHVNKGVLFFSRCRAVVCDKAADRRTACASLLWHNVSHVRAKEVNLSAPQVPHSYFLFPLFSLKT